jgi:hypothetical protein
MLKKRMMLLAALTLPLAVHAQEAALSLPPTTSDEKTFFDAPVLRASPCEARRIGEGFSKAAKRRLLPILPLLVISYSPSPFLNTFQPSSVSKGSWKLYARTAV